KGAHDFEIGPVPAADIEEFASDRATDGADDLGALVPHGGHEAEQPSDPAFPRALCNPSISEGLEDPSAGLLPESVADERETRGLAVAEVRRVQLPDFSGLRLRVQPQVAACSASSQAPTSWCIPVAVPQAGVERSEEHTSELQSRFE